MQKIRRKPQKKCANGERKDNLNPLSPMKVGLFCKSKELLRVQVMIDDRLKKEPLGAL